MKTGIFCLLFFTASTRSLFAHDPIVMGEVKKSDGTFTLFREKNDSKTTLAVVVDHRKPPIWTKTWFDFPGGGSLLDYWQIVDGCVQGNDVAVLIGMHEGLLWINAIKNNGTWTIDFAQELYGAASLAIRTQKIALVGCNSVVVTDDHGMATTFTRSETGAVLKNGASFSNTPPYSIVTKP